MPRPVRTFLAIICGMLMVCCLVGALLAYGLGFGPDAPMPNQVTLPLVLLALCGACLCGVGMWLLACKA